MDYCTQKGTKRKGIRTAFYYCCFQENITGFWCLLFTVITVACVLQSGAIAVRNNLSCHFTETDDDLFFADETNFTFPDNSIFFIQTSCTGLKFREACSVESAARVHPNRQINILFVGPVQQRCLIVKPMLQILLYNNVKAYRIRLHKVVANTPVQSLIASGALRNSSYPIHHTADILRYAILYKHGGVYLDLDVMVVKPFNSLPESRNFVGKEENDTIGSAVVGLSKEGIGKVISNLTLSFLAKDFHPSSWSHSSTHVLWLALQEACSTKKIHYMTPENCHGLRIYPQEYFYPLRYPQWRIYFDKNQEIQKFIHNEPFTYHLWNYLSHNETILEGSLYAKLMKSFCPSVSSSYFQNGRV